MDTKEKTNFNIYKIDRDKASSIFGIKNKKLSSEEMILIFIKGNINYIKKKGNFDYKILAYEKVSGIVYKSSNESAWKSFISEIFCDDKEVENFDMENTNYSYVLYYTINDDIYATTGGYGSNIIKKMTVYNYGLHILTKIIKKENPAIKRIIENSTIGNKASNTLSYRSTTSFMREEDIGSIYRELAIEIDKNLSSKLGIHFEKEERADKKIRLINKDSLVISRSLTISELNIVLVKLNEIEQQEDNFALGYFVHVRKKQIKESRLYRELIQKIISISSDYDKWELNFEIIGDDYDRYYFNSELFVILDENNETIIERKSPIGLKELIQFLHDKNKKLSIHALDMMLKKWRIKTVDETGEDQLYPIPICQSIQGYLDFDGTICYLFNGSWHILDHSYKDTLDANFKKLFDKWYAKSKELSAKYDLCKNYISEDLYNKSFASSSDVIYTHTSLISFIELSDLIFGDDKIVYFMHNKTKCNGSGVRDLCNQVLAAANLFVKQTRSSERTDFIKKYYQTISNNKDGNIKKICSTVDEFDNLLNTQKKQYYILGFVEGFNNNTRSNYVKYLLFHLERELAHMGIELVVMSVTSNS